PETAPDDAVPAAAGPVLIQVAYKVDARYVDRFEQAARALATSRRRTGATTWDLWRDVADPSRFVEQYTVVTWGEHIAQREERMTGYDRQLERQAVALAAPDPQVSHFVRPEHMPRADRGIAVADHQNRGILK
ncbi:MAG: MFS transporter, partial [Bifidobacteriaceae bacterium]|nr:MFS transporter [Bifidobacteriaceae bacterium]